jgi:hypothetical protein
MATFDTLKVTVQLTLWERYRSTFAILAGAKNPWQWAISALKNTLLASALFFASCLMLCEKSESYFSIIQRALLWGVLFVIFFSPIFLLVFPFLMLLLLVLTRRAVLRRPVVYSLSTERIEARAADSESNIAWSTLVMIRETKKSFVFYSAKNRGFVIPKRCFADESEIETLRELIRNSFTGRTAYRT